MLVSQMQQQQQINAAQAAEIHDLKQQVAEMRDLRAELRAALRQMQPKEAVLAAR
jgi:thioesterase domain-containing protein